jgi:hypothetical protein
MIIAYAPKDIFEDFMRRHSLAVASTMARPPGFVVEKTLAPAHAAAEAAAAAMPAAAAAGDEAGDDGGDGSTEALPFIHGEAEGSEITDAFGAAVPPASFGPADTSLSRALTPEHADALRHYVFSQVAVFTDATNPMPASVWADMLSRDAELVLSVTSKRLRGEAWSPASKLRAVYDTVSGAGLPTLRRSGGMLAKYESPEAWNYADAIFVEAEGVLANAHA